MPKKDDQPRKTTEMGCLLVGRNDLFGARMLPFINALRIGHDYDLPVKIYWPAVEGNPTNIGEYTDIFSAEFLQKHFISDAEFRTLTKHAIRLNKNHATSIDDTVAQVRSGAVLALNGVTASMVLNGEDPLKVNQSYRATLDRISFTPLVAQNIQKIKAATKGKAFLAYHVRHGDVTTSYRAKNKPWTNKFVPSEFFEQHYKKHHLSGDVNALVFGDFQPSLDWLSARCDGLQQIGNVIDFGTLGSLQRDFLELYAMSRATQIIGPKNSGFSQLAAGLGGVEFHDIMKVLKRKDYEIVFEKLSNRITNNPNSMSSDGEIGQCLAHLAKYMMRTQQYDRLREILLKEIDRGNRITFLFPLLADVQLAQLDYKGVLETRAKSLCVPMFDPISVANLDALAAQASFHLGDTIEATRLLSVAVFHSPYATHVADAYGLLNENELLTTHSFYPVDTILMQILFKNAKQFKPVYFAWEWRQSLISNFQRPLTIAGAADHFIKTMDIAIEKREPTPLEQARFDSFKSLVLMGLGQNEDALSLSIQAVDMAPTDAIVLKRHVQNLLMNRDYKHALRYAKILVENAPNVPMYQMLLADCYYELRKRKKAVEIYSAFTAQELRFLGGTLPQAAALNTLKRYDETKIILDRVLPEARWPDRYLEKSVAAEIELGSQTDIQPFLETLNKEAYAARNVNHMLATIKMANGDFSGAEQDTKRAIQFAPNLPRFKELLVRVYLAQNRTEDAAKVISTLPPLMQKRFKNAIS